MIVGIVGHEAAKFSPEAEVGARRIIRDILIKADAVCSGGCHLGGIDIWAEEEADKLGKNKIIFKPTVHAWGSSGGYKERNLKIAAKSDEIHCIVVNEYPSGFSGMKFNYCHHCKTDSHIKSGGCWTTKRSLKPVWHVINQMGREVMYIRPGFIFIESDFVPPNL